MVEKNVDTRDFLYSSFSLTGKSYVMSRVTMSSPGLYIFFFNQTVF